MSLTNVPEKIVSGDTVIFSVSDNVVGDYPLSSPVLNITFRSTSEMKTESATLNASNKQFEFNFNASGMDQGSHSWTAFLTDSTNQRFTVGTGRTLVLPDPTSPSINLSKNEKMLEAIEAAIQGVATDPQMMMSINGRMIQRYSITELLKFRGLYKREVALERKAMGLGNQDKVRIRFNNSTWGNR